MIIYSFYIGKFEVLKIRSVNYFFLELEESVEVLIIVKYLLLDYK